VKHRGSVSVTARQQTYCASNLEQGDGEVPAPSVLRKAKLWNDSRNCWRNAGAGRPSRWSLPDVQARRKVTMTKKD